MSTETRVYFGVFEFGDDPCVVTSLMRVEPTSAWVKGEHYSQEHPTAIRTHSRWSLDSGLPRSASIEEHLTALLVILKPLRKQIVEASERFSTRIGVAQYIYETNPQFFLEPATLQGLADLRLLVYFDQYCLGDATGS